MHIINYYNSRNFINFNTKLGMSAYFTIRIIICNSIQYVCLNYKINALMHKKIIIKKYYSVLTFRKLKLYIYRHNIRCSTVEMHIDRVQYPYHVLLNNAI